MTLPTLTIKYALDNGRPQGPLYDSTAEAGLNTWDGAPLLRVYVHPDGRIIHTEKVGS